MHTYINIYKCACIHTHIQIYTPNTYIHTLTDVCMHTHIHTFIHTYRNIYMHAYIHKHIHMCMHTYTHTNIHTFLLQNASGLSMRSVRSIISSAQQRPKNVLLNTPCPAGKTRYSKKRCLSTQLEQSSTSSMRATHSFLPMLAPRTTTTSSSLMSGRHRWTA